jgi:GTP-binding protein HflX
MPMLETERAERAVIVGITTRDHRRDQVNEYLDELQLLAESAGAVVVDRILQDRENIDAAFFIGRGKAEELASIVEDHTIDLVIFDDDLSTVQVRNLERLIKCKIMDRSAIILDIFASRAKTSEAKAQVELAQLQYMLPRLTRQWTHLSKQFGGIGTKGPGETQIETDRRTIRTKISRLNARLNKISREREVQRKGRENFPRVALVGYTNVGKSTLLNWFTKAGVLVEDRLFATLDSTVRLVELTPAHRILLSDTVGFIRKLPHHLVASFKSTLDEVVEADILLHVVDICNPLFEEQISIVNSTLEEIGAHGKPTITVFNKIDRVKDRSIIQYLARSHTNPVFISATRGINMGTLNKKIIELLEESIADETLTLGHEDYAVISRIHDLGEIIEKKYNGEEIVIRFRMNRAAAERLKKEVNQRSGD